MATSAIRDFLLENEMDVYLAIFDKSSFSVGSQLLDDVEGVACCAARRSTVQTELALNLVRT